MGNAMGFTTFQGAQAYIRQPVYLEFNYTTTQKEGPIDIKFENCDYNITGNTFHDYPISKNCECNSCEARCTYSPYSKDIAVLNGINGIRILYIYC